VVGLAVYRPKISLENFLTAPTASLTYFGLKLV